MYGNSGIMEGLAPLSVKLGLIPNYCRPNTIIPKIKECIVDIDKFVDERQTLLVNLSEPGSRNQISIVARVNVKNISKEMPKFVNVISIKNVLATKLLCISVSLFGEPVKSIKGLHNLPPPPLPLPGPTDNPGDEPPLRQGGRPWKPTAVEFSAGRGFSRPPNTRVANRNDVMMNLKQENVLLILAMLTAAMMFAAACAFAGVVSNDTETEKARDSSLTGSFVLFNSAGFIVSVAVVISMLYHFPLKPLLQISVSSWFGSYMCLMMKLSPHEAMLLLCVSVPFLLLAAAGKLFRFSHD